MVPSSIAKLGRRGRTYSAASRGVTLARNEGRACEMKTLVIPMRTCTNRDRGCRCAYR